MFETLDTLDTEISADSVEWCPAQKYQDIFVCGMYHLTEEKDSNVNDKHKIGRIYLLKVVEDKIHTLQKIHCPAVFDMKWAHKSCYNKILLGVVNANGFLQIYQLDDQGETENLKLMVEQSVIPCTKEISALSLDWSTGNINQENIEDIKITVSNSEGAITLFQFCNEEDGLKRIDSWLAHDYEAWITAFDYFNTNIIYSGGDDSKLLQFDIRIGNKPTTKCRWHSAGVTSLHFNGRKEYYFVSGSYDETLCTWDTRHFRHPISECNLNGGIWRLKWDPFWSRYILAACMYGGFRIIDCNILESPKVIGDYREHKSIAYGSDWSYLTWDSVMEKQIYSKENNVLVGTCSFYDHMLKLSAVTLETS